MVLDIFKKPYTLRRFEKSELVRGRSCAKYTDSTVMLNVQPLTMTELVTLPDGIRRSKNVKAIGKVLIRTADENAGTLADRICYRGEWYECTGSDIWGNTPVGQTEAVFGLIPNVEAGDILLVSAPVQDEKADAADDPANADGGEQI